MKSMSTTAEPHQPQRSTLYSDVWMNHTFISFPQKYYKDPFVTSAACGSVLLMSDQVLTRYLKKNSWSVMRLMSRTLCHSRRRTTHVCVLTSTSHFSIAASSLISFYLGHVGPGSGLHLLHHMSLWYY